MGGIQVWLENPSRRRIVRGITQRRGLIEPARCSRRAVLFGVISALTTQANERATYSDAGHFRRCRRAAAPTHYPGSFPPEVRARFDRRFAAARAPQLLRALIAIWARSDSTSRLSVSISRAWVCTAATAMLV